MPPRTPPKRETWLPLVATGFALFCIVQFMQNGAEDERRSDPAAAPDQPANAVDQESALQSLASALPSTGAGAQQLHVLEVRALVAQGKLAAARARALDYFARWPDGPDTQVLETLTGAHPRATSEPPGDGASDKAPAR